MFPLMLLVAGASFGVISIALAPEKALPGVQTFMIKTLSGGHATSGDCNIKGNVSQNSGARIYHVPGQKFYSRTRIMSEYGERWFCSEREARAAGWRRARS